MLRIANSISRLKPVGKIRLNNSGNYSSHDTRPNIPLELNTATQRVDAIHMNSSSWTMPSPVTFHLDVPPGATVFLRVRTRSLPVIRHFVKGRAGAVQLGYAVTTSSTKFLPNVQSGDIALFASSSSALDATAFPPIDIAVPMTTEQSSIQITFYAMPLYRDLIEIWADQKYAVIPGTANDTQGWTTMEEGWVKPWSTLTGTIIDSECGQMTLDGMLKQPYSLPFAFICTGTWYQAQALSFENLNGTPLANPQADPLVDDLSEHDTIEAVSVKSGICHYA